MIEVIKTPGKHIAYETNSKSITFGDDDLSINLKNRQMDEPVMIDICSDKQGFLVVGAETGERYVAQVEIPAKEYTEAEVETSETNTESTNAERTPTTFDIDKCTIYLWGMEE